MKKGPQPIPGIRPMGACASACSPVVPVTVIVPAYNEADIIAETIRSLQQQTVTPREVIVVDDGSTDGTGDINACARRDRNPLVNTGSKAGAQNVALRAVKTPFVVAIDADTTLAADALEMLLTPFDADEVVAACGFVVPRTASLRFALR